MINLQRTIDRVNVLLAEDTESSVTYAALEARLALEKVVYDRLRQRHDYISHDQLRKWQPGAVINTLMTEVDPHVTETAILSIGKSVEGSGINPEDDEYVEVGREIGFDPKRIAKMWNALAKLALHVRLPEHKADHIPDYGDIEKIRAKVAEVVVELERLATGTMTFSGMGEGGDITFVCSCGEKNRRRASLLQVGKHVHCINPDCKATWKAVQEEDGLGFESVTVTVNCEECKGSNLLNWREIRDMKHEDILSFSCYSCEHKNYVQWRLMQMRPDASIKDS